MKTNTSFLLACSLIACGPESADIAQHNAPAHEAPLTHAMATGEQFGEVGQLLTYWQEKGKDQGGSCSGVLIAPDVVLTAAHCVPGWPHGFNSSALTFFDVTPDGVLGPASFNTVKYWVAIPGSENIAAAMAGDLYGQTPDTPLLADLALAVLNRPLEDAPIALLPQSEMATQRPSDGAKIGFLGVGYGIYEHGWFSLKLGKRHYAPLVVDTVNPGAFRASSNVSRICKGDSGGAVLHDVGGQREVLGIFSHGNSLLWALFSPCNGKIWSTRVDVYTPWIEEKLQDLCDEGIRVESMCQ